MIYVSGIIIKLNFIKQPYKDLIESLKSPYHKITTPVDNICAAVSHMSALWHT